MSEILQIRFGRADRTYRFGERVTGWVLVRASRGADCKGVHIRRFWRTHGKGNEEKGDSAVATLHRGSLPDGGPHIFEFDFPAPPGPFTYHGWFLNVDQSVEAWVDMPLARDPTVREEYVLLPGKPLPPSPLLLDVAENPIKAIVPTLSGFVGVSVSIIGLSLLLTANPLGFGLLLVGSLFFLPLLRRKAEERLGRSASARLASLVVGPGADVEVEVKVAPPKAVRLEKAIVELEAREVCVSGSGSNRRIHRRTVFSGGGVLSGAMMLKGGVEKVFKSAVRIPEEAPGSFKGSANQLLWEATVRLDISGWPDWVRRIPLVVWWTEDRLGAGETADSLLPQETSESSESSEEQRGAIQELLPSPATAPDQEPLHPPGPSPGPEAVPPPAPVPAPEPDLPFLAGAINDAGIFGKERDRLINKLMGGSFSFSFEVRRVDRTIGFYSEAEFHDGRAVTGVLTGSGLEVVVYFPKRRTDEVKAWRPGSVHNVQAAVVNWDRLRKRPELMARG